LWLKIFRENHLLTGYYSPDGTNWTQVGEIINVASLDNFSKNYNGWCGNRQGLYVQGKPAYFDLYIYRDAYSPILAECPANQFGNNRATLSDGTTVLDNIHNGNWALYAGVEFGSKDYPKASGSIKITASCNTKGGKVEVWLDAIDTGKMIATCKIINTGNLTGFKQFTAKTIQTMGRHDVYLRFVGTGDDMLFTINKFSFISRK